MRVLVTGSKGQVGHCLTQQLSGLDDVSFLAVDRDELDITDRAAVFKTVESFRPTIIINAAAHTAVDKAESDTELSFAINADGPQFLAEAAHEVEAAILHISTDYVFEGNKSGEYVETDPTNPQGVYGKSKLAGELAVARACPKHIILRTAWVFGESGNNFVKTMLRLAKDRDELSIVGDQFGGPTYAGDIAKALISISEKISSDETVEYGIYHYSGLPHVNWFEFANTIFDCAISNGVLNNKPKLNSITTDQYPTPAKRPSNSRMSTDKITSSFSIEASDWNSALTSIKKYVDA
ncbi:TPA: dTDP-4-dehydrorhamnose reductase [Vibrio vulnificus]|nr:dTDP-4-dehydrorhamnose reductase [Vibrio vulnificus]HAS8445448.1 dTDP-4-dehydrorhamnose reductase [Vibrio vulnificus]HAS8454903.1 dTDP-4-dehydrorhamnose reductase [Vibrio vulnificus]HDY7725114.1 dTDP-4-dehydrorhamnose reductase [Vibrio vulnificus]